MTPDSEDSKRLAARETVLKSGQIVFRDIVIDCVILDISGEGARVRTAVMVPIPEQVTLRLRGGAVLPAVRRWARGTEIGLAFSGSVSLNEERSQEALVIRKVLQEKGLDEALRRLRVVNFFDDPELQEAAEQAEAARAKLEAVLRALATTS
jgi:hypothetical protein